MIGLLRRAANRIRAFFNKQPLDGDLDAEMTSHLELVIEENKRRGMSSEEARRQALVRFGGVEQTKLHHRGGCKTFCVRSVLRE
jgi:hypothetical protein